MKRYIFVFFIFLISFYLNILISPQPVVAVGNNKFGIHISHAGDLEKASELVNSSGGDWGYVTLVIRDDEMNRDQWQSFFDRCRKEHLIPIVRLATHLEGESWVKPRIEDMSKWADFLAQFNWPVKNRYIIVYNEPNHAKEWGGAVDPKEYALILDEAIKVFKKRSFDFFVLNAGLDQAAPNSKTTMEESNFLRQVNEAAPGIFDRLDGWSSHSYPNHGFIGKPWEKGKATVAGYLWEMAFLKNNFGLTKELPVFNTETGWPQRFGKRITTAEPYYDSLTVADYIRQAYDLWIKDDKVVAVTPFILNYPFSPFSAFSWLDKDGNTYPQFETTKVIAKEKGEPEQIESYKILRFNLPPFLPANFVFEGKIILENNGQSIWGEKPFVLAAIDNDLKINDLVLPEGILIKPNERAEFSYTIETNDKGGNYPIAWANIPAKNLKVFSAGTLTAGKESLLNKVFKKIFSIWKKV